MYGQIFQYAPGVFGKCIVVTEVPVVVVVDDIEKIAVVAKVVVGQVEFQSASVVVGKVVVVVVEVVVQIVVERLVVVVQSCCCCVRNALLQRSAGEPSENRRRNYQWQSSLRFQCVAPAYGQIFQHAPVVVGKCIVVVVVVEKIVVVAKVVVGQVEFQSASVVVVGKVVVVIVVEVVVQIVVEKVVVVVVVVQGCCCCCCGQTALLQWSVGEPSEDRRPKSQWQWGLSQLGIGQ